jgi:sugar-specific transcriptional regulator TrmB
MQKDITASQRPPQILKYFKLGGFDLEEVDVLVRLGLTNRQARVYLSLSKSGCGKAKTIADLSFVNRQEIYRVLEDLQQMGLVQKNVSVPTTYTATPLADVIKMLLEQKRTELTFIRQKTKQLIKKLQSSPYPLTVEPERQNHLGTIFEGDRCKKYRQTITTARQSINIVTSWKRFKQITTLLETPLQQALQKHIPIQIVTEKPSNQSLPNWVIIAQTSNKKPPLKLKIVSKLPNASIVIFDQKLVAVAFHPESSITQGPDLWTTNPALLALSQTYFNIIWTQTNTTNE